MTPAVTDTEIYALLVRLDAAVSGVYPPFGFPLHGELAKTPLLTRIVRDWLAEISQEAKR